MNTVLIYINTSKEVGDVDHLKVFANEKAVEKWFKENDPEALRSSTRSSELMRNEQDRAPNYHNPAVDCGLGDYAEFVVSISHRVFLPDRILSCPLIPPSIIFQPKL
jgi:hypothetical protein